MNTKMHALLSGSIALGLVAFVSVSAFAAGAAAASTVLGFGLIAVHGLLEIALLSYRQPHFVSAGLARGRRALPRASATVVDFPAAARKDVLARAA